MDTKVPNVYLYKPFNSQSTHYDYRISSICCEALAKQQPGRFVICDLSRSDFFRWRWFWVAAVRWISGSSFRIVRAQPTWSPTDLLLFPVDCDIHKFFCCLRSNVFDAASLFQTNHMVHWNVLFSVWHHGFFVWCDVHSQRHGFFEWRVHSQHVYLQEVISSIRWVH